MKKSISIITFVFMLLTIASSALSDQLVGGYFRQDGTYVEPYVRSSPNQARSDNYSSQGNVNPYTGEKGYEQNEYSNQPKFNHPRRNSGWGDSDE